MPLTDYILNGVKSHSLVSDSTLHVVTPISNPARYHSRYKIFRDFAAAMRTTANVQFHVVELAFGDRHHEVTGAASDAPGGSELQLRSSAELWHKENLINLGVRHLLPTNWRYVAWIDGDVFFNTPNWALETIHQLQSYQVIQPFSECCDMGPNGNTLQLFRSFGKIVQSGQRVQAKSDEPYAFGHTGFAWACTRRFWENVGGLLDKAPLGSADHHMGFSMINRADDSVHGKMSEPFKRMVRDWQSNAYRETHGHVGYIPGTLAHRWHGSKRRRFYRERWQILIEHGFDPNRDLRRDAQGLLYIAGKPHLENAIRQYMRARNEDGIDED